VYTFVFPSIIRNYKFTKRKGKKEKVMGEGKKEGMGKKGTMGIAAWDFDEG
jgi:hypothetical protein